MSEVDRCYRLTAIRAPELVDIQGLGRGFFDELETIATITDLQIKAKVEKYRRGKPNYAEITLYNCAQVTRDDFVKLPQKVRLEAGYDNVPRLLFVGDLRFASNEKKGTEWLTKLQLGDGARAVNQARVSRSYAKGTPIATIVGALAKAFGVPMPDLPSDLQQRIATGEVLSGNAFDELERVLAPFGMECSFQNGRLQVLRVDDPLRNTARLIAPPPDGGMIDSPVIDPPKPRAASRTHHRVLRRTSTAIPRVPKLKVKHTLYPEMVPAELIELQSRSINGRFINEVVTHDLDLFGNDWTTIIEAIAA